MGTSYYKRQELGVAQMMKNLAKPRTQVCELCGATSGLTTQLTPSVVRNEGLSDKAKCRDCWKRFWAARNAAIEAEKI